MTGKSYQHTNNPLLAAAKKTGMKREHSPSNPYKRKARGKENNPGANSTGLFACERVRGREGIRRCGKGARAQDDPDMRRRCIDRAKHLVMRRAPECLETFWLILKNGKNRKESIWQLVKNAMSK